jgi:adenine-specific DNA-methyltransferase
MDKLKLHTPDFAEANAARIAELFPNCVTEKEVGRDDKGNAIIGPAIDFDLLRQELSSDLVEGPQERYRLDWPGKRESLALANAPIRKTLRPCKEESVDFDTTQNLYIEGDNLDALKLLQETYLGKVKMIYIDPPYNTGNDFIYDDNFSISREEYEAASGAVDEEGNAMFDEEKWKQNSSASGRFHSEWLSMIYPRLKLARNLLRDDGVIFISIDENEVSSLINLSREIFGADSLVGVFKWNKTSKAPTLSKKIRKKFEYVLCLEKADCQRLKGPDSYNEQAPLLNPVNPVKKLKFPPNTLKFGFPDGKYQGGTYGEGNKQVILHQNVEVKNSTNKENLEISARFKWSQTTVDERMREGIEISFKTSKFTTIYYSLDNSNDKFIAPSDLLSSDECDVLRNDEGFLELKDLFDGLELFNYCKPISLPKYLSRMMNMSDGVYLDFFSGSGTTAHAIMQLNAEDGGKRRHIMVQIPEPCDNKSEAFKAGYKTIAEIGKERIRRAGKKILSEWQAKQASSAEHLKLDTENPDASPPDIGFRVLKIDSSNMADVYYQPDQLTQDALALHVDNLKPGRAPEDLLFQVLLDWGIDLSLPITEVTIEGKKVFFVDDNAVAACFDTGLTEAFCKALAKREPLRAVFRDASYASDSTKINIEQIFKALSPHTELKTL